MGYVYAKIMVRGRQQRSIRVLVDTGATYLVLDPKTIKELDPAATPYQMELSLADKRKVKAKLYIAEVEAEGRKGPAMVA